MCELPPRRDTDGYTVPVRRNQRLSRSFPRRFPSELGWLTAEIVGLPAPATLREGGVRDLDRLRVEPELREFVPDPGAVVSLQVDLAVDHGAPGGEAVLERTGRLLEVDPRGEPRNHG